MDYDYEQEKPWVLTDEGQRQFLKVYEWARRALETTGAFTLGKAMNAASTPDSFKGVALVDRLVELGSVELVPGQTCASQYRVYRRKP